MLANGLPGPINHLLTLGSCSVGVKVHVCFAQGCLVFGIRGASQDPLLNVYWQPGLPSAVIATTKLVLPPAVITTLSEELVQNQSY